MIKFREGTPITESAVPPGPMDRKWVDYRSKCRLVSPANKQRLTVIVVGAGLAGASAAATLAQLGYNVKVFVYHDSPRRAHSIAAQGGINAAKNYQGDGDSIYRLFYDTIKGGDYRSREANVWRLAEVSANIIDQSVALGVPFAREYGGLLANRSFGGVQVQRTFYARGQTGQQLLLGAYSAMMRWVDRKKIEYFPYHEMLDVVLIDGKARGVIVRNLLTGELKRYSGHAVVLATGGYSNVFYLSTNAMNSNVTAAWRAHKRGAYFANPAFTQIHPTCLPAEGKYQSKLTLMSESLRNDGRVWVPKEEADVERVRSGRIKPADIPEEKRDYFLERMYPAFGNLVPRDVAARAIKKMCDAGFSVIPEGDAVFLDFKDAIARLGRDVIDQRYGNLFEMYEKITGESPWDTPMKIYPAPHYTMGGLWVDYKLQTNVPGLFAIGECNFSDHGANRLGASALMQGLADGYFVLPYTIGDYLADEIRTPLPDTQAPAFDQAEKEVRSLMEKIYQIGGNTSVDELHRTFGRIMWDYCGISRTAEGLQKAYGMVCDIEERFWKDVKVPGKLDEKNSELEKAQRLLDFIQLGKLMIIDAFHRNESCGGHFREEYQTPEGEPLRNDEEYAYAAAWEYTGTDEPVLHKEPLQFEVVKPSVRSYK